MEFWQSRKYDILDDQRRKREFYQDKIKNGPLGQKLLHLKMQIADLKQHHQRPDKSKLIVLNKKAADLNELGDKLSREASAKRQTKLQLENELDRLKGETRSVENRLNAIKIRSSKQKRMKNKE